VTVSTVQGWLSDKVESGALQPDPVQMQAAGALDDMLERLSDYRGQTGLFARFTRKDTPKGLYLWGGVGRGKSMLMDVFFRLAPNDRKRRVHFHAFMIDVHARIGEWRQLDRAGRRANPYHKRGDGDDPIAPVARSIATEATLLCFDEFQVNDIANASLLARLFEALWSEGVVVVATSNRRPEDLYKNGLNRALFVPFIKMMPDHLTIFAFDGQTDHRLRALSAAPVYYHPLGPDTDASMDAMWQRVTADAKMRPMSLSVQGRTLHLEKTGRGAVRESFDNLCNQALGAADYLALAETFHTLMLDHVPKMGPEMRNQAKRFVALVDALYETRTKLIISAATAPADLYPSGDGAFEFERTVSRLIEMRSEAYLAEARKTPPDMPD
jgi:cell division protein ZapE